MGVKVAISTDAHSTDGLRCMRYGVGQARRGWLEPRDVKHAAWAQLCKLFERS
jgi:DNA polymerase (family 10)